MEKVHAFGEARSPSMHRDELAGERLGQCFGAVQVLGAAEVVGKDRESRVGLLRPVAPADVTRMGAQRLMGSSADPLKKWTFAWAPVAIPMSQRSNASTFDTILPPLGGRPCVSSGGGAASAPPDRIPQAGGKSDQRPAARRTLDAGEWERHLAGTVPRRCRCR